MVVMVSPKVASGELDAAIRAPLAPCRPSAAALGALGCCKSKAADGTKAVVCENSATMTKWPSQRAATSIVAQRRWLSPYVEDSL